jgi:hypothetical protein
MGSGLALQHLAWPAELFDHAFTLLAIDTMTRLSCLSPQCAKMSL